MLFDGIKPTKLVVVEYKSVNTSHQVVVAPRSQLKKTAERGVERPPVEEGNRSELEEKYTQIQD